MVWTGMVVLGLWPSEMKMELVKAIRLELKPPALETTSVPVCSAASRAVLLWFICRFSQVSCGRIAACSCWTWAWLFWLLSPVSQRIPTSNGSSWSAMFQCLLLSVAKPCIVFTNCRWVDCASNVTYVKNLVALMACLAPPVSAAACSNFFILYILLCGLPICSASLVGPFLALILVSNTQCLALENPTFFCLTT